MTPIRRLAVALAVSVAVNLFLGGFIAARALRGGGHHDARHEHGHFLGPRGLSRDGDSGAEQALRRTMRKREVAFRGQKQEMHVARDAVSAAFQAEPFDPHALERALTALRAETAASQALMHESLIEAAPALSTGQRRRLAERVLEREPGFGRRAR